jgi:hypothetical protein
MKTRTNVPVKPKTPVGPLAWNTLMSKAIQRALAKGDPRVSVLRRAIQAGKSEEVLRGYGIISEADLAREFKQT